MVIHKNSLAQEKKSNLTFELKKAKAFNSY